MMSPFSAPASKTAVQARPPQRRPRWEWLAASIALNLVLIGFVASFLFAPAPRHQPLVAWQRDLLPSLNAGDAAIVDSATRRISDQQTDWDARIHIDYTQTRSLLAVEPLDRDALRQALTEIASSRHSEQTAVLGIFLDEIVQLSPDGRRKILAAMERESRRYSPASGH